MNGGVLDKMRRTVHRLISFGCGIAFNRKSLIHRRIPFNGKILADRGIAIHGGVPDKMGRTLHRLISFDCGIAFNSKSLIYRRVAFDRKILANGKIIADRGIVIQGGVSGNFKNVWPSLIFFQIGKAAA